MALFPSAHVLACKAFSGKSAKDQQVAKRICEVYKDTPDVIRVQVHSSLMWVDISEAMYRAMYVDRISGKKLVRILVQLFQGHSGQSVVTVYMLWDGTKVIEGDVTLLSGIEVTYLDD